MNNAKVILLQKQIEHERDKVEKHEEGIVVSKRFLEGWKNKLAQHEKELKNEQSK